MPKRILDDSLLDSRSLEVLSPAAQDAFPRFILLADDFGCFEVNPVILRARGWSRRPDVTEAMVEEWIREYAERQASDPDTGEKLAPVLMLWTHIGRRYAYLTGWHGPHGQKRRDEYGPTKPHGSKRKTPAPPADLVAAVMAGNVRAVDGKPPGTDREPTGNPDAETPNDSAPAREPTGNKPGIGRDAAGKSMVPAPAVPVAVPVAAGNCGGPALVRSFTTRGAARDAERVRRYPQVSRLHEILAEPFPGITRPATEQDEMQLEARCATRGVMLFAHDCCAWVADTGKDPKSLGLFARAMDEILEAPEPRPGGENPRPGDRDFNDPEAWSDFNAYQTRSGVPIPVEGGAVRSVRS